MWDEDAPRASDAGAGVDAPSPVWVDVVLEAAELRILVHDDRVTFGRKTVLHIFLLDVNTASLRGRDIYLVRVTADASDPFDSEVEWLYRESGFLEEWHDEAAQTAVDVQAELVLRRELAKRDNVILAPVWEVYSGTNELFRK